MHVYVLFKKLSEVGRANAVGPYLFVVFLTNDKKHACLFLLQTPVNFDLPFN